MSFKRFFLYSCIFSLSLFSFQACKAQEVAKNTKNWETIGRVDKLKNNQLNLISAASNITIKFEGNTCDVMLKSLNEYGKHAYVVFELDGKYLGRYRVNSAELAAYPVKIEDKKAQTHILKIFKATEASTGGLLFGGITAKVLEYKSTPKKKIEFIGDSITSGMGNDSESIPCHSTDDWFDQHNGYLAYGPYLARELNADFILNSVSGMGMYRNWNTEASEEASMPDVYQNLGLNTDSSKKYDFSFKPDLISICLGTNDLSDGDGKKNRKPFDAEHYVSNYVKFVKMLLEHNPNAQIVLLNSPMVNGEKNKVFENCLERIKDAFKDNKSIKPIQIFHFKPMSPKGCDYHPDKKDDIVMANELKDTFIKLLK